MSMPQPPPLVQSATDEPAFLDGGQRDGPLASKPHRRCRSVATQVLLTAESFLPQFRVRVS
jgi:hypothetical protein